MRLTVKFPSKMLLVKLWSHRTTLVGTVFGQLQMLIRQRVCERDILPRPLGPSNWACRNPVAVTGGSPYPVDIKLGWEMLLPRSNFLP